MTDKEHYEQILQMCYEKHIQFEVSPENDEFFLDNQESKVIIENEIEKLASFYGVTVDYYRAEFL